VVLDVELLCDIDAVLALLEAVDVPVPMVPDDVDWPVEIEPVPVDVEDPGPLVVAVPEVITWPGTTHRPPTQARPALHALPARHPHENVPSAQS
jgi:hypothetical protein